VAERLLPSGVVYFLSDYWPASVDMHTKYWQKPARRWYMRLPRRLLSKFALAMIEREGRPKLKFEHAICVSAAVRQILVDAGIPLQQAHVIHGGTRLDGFRSIRQRSFNGSQLNLLYAGQLVEHKGVHTAVEAVAKLVKERNVRNLHLNVVGAGHPAYEASLARRVKDAHLEDYVSFKGRVAKEEMPEILEQADVLVFPSIYEEPFARMTQEAMLAGLVVVGTTTGGTKEILEDGENGLTFEAEDADDLARQLERLLDDPAFCTRLATSARRTVIEQFTLDRMVDRIEGYLELVAGDLQEAHRG
jgi:glycosyltransferase involved in cell wall biosynthesis